MDFSDAYLERKIKKLEHQARVLTLSIAYHKHWQKRLDREREIKQITAVQMDLFTSQVACVNA